MAKREDAVDLDRQLAEVAGPHGLRVLSDWIAATSLWTDPEVYKQIQLVYPRTRRRHSGEEFRAEVEGFTVWRNEPAARAFWRARGVSTGGAGSPRDFRNSHLCHIYEASAHDPDHYTNLANLVAVPRALAYVTEWSPIRKLLQWNAFQLYHYRGPRGASPSKPSYVPVPWPGVKKLTAGELQAVVSRLKRARSEHPNFASQRKNHT